MSAERAGTFTRRWPDFFIVGAAKGGTTSLFDSLARHDAVFLPKVKEPHFFSSVTPTRGRAAFFRVVTSESDYLELFADARPDQTLGEASTSYLWDSHAASRIQGVVPDAKIIAILRDPAERAYSHYLNDVREGLERRDFLTAVEEDLRRPDGLWGNASLYVQLGFYAVQLRRYLDLFSDVLVLFFEEFIEDVPGHLDRTCEFLGVPAFRDLADAATHSNPYARPRNRFARAALGSGAARRLARTSIPQRPRTALREALQKRESKPTMPREARSLLEDAYRHEAETLRKLLGRPVPWTA